MCVSGPTEASVPLNTPEIFPLLCWALWRVTAASATAGSRPLSEPRPQPPVPPPPPRHHAQQRGRLFPSHAFSELCVPDFHSWPSSFLGPRPFPLIPDSTPASKPRLSLHTPHSFSSHPSHCLWLLVPGEPGSSTPHTPSLVSPPGPAPSTGPSLTLPGPFQQKSPVQALSRPAPNASLFQ